MDKIDAFLYINLTHRTDRKEHVLKELLKICTDEKKIIRINAVYNMCRGDIGCSESHIVAQKMVMEHPEWKIVCIVEDDFTIYDGMISTVNECFGHIVTTNWDMFLLAYNKHLVEYDNTDNDKIIKISNAQTTSGYIVNTRYISTLYDNFNNGVKLFERGVHNNNILSELYSCDIYWKKLQKIDRWFSTISALGYQYKSFSDVSKTIANYMT